MVYYYQLYHKYDGKKRATIIQTMSLYLAVNSHFLTCLLAGFKPLDIMAERFFERLI